METILFGKYQLCERLAEGGMAVVWRAKLVGPGGFEKELCIKQVRKELAARAEFLDLFVAEAKVTVSLSHANIVPVYELGMVDGTYFLALELIDGPPLSKLIKLGALPAPLAAYVVEQVLRGLEYAHRRGVVHRDLSAANVLISQGGEVKIVDFGIAAPKGGSGPRGGSRGYMAPEQEKGARADARADLYAVGVLLWELLAGRRHEPGVALDGAPESLRGVIARATAADPNDRFPDAAAMLSQISRFLRDLSMGPTQSELSSHVRRRLPELPRPRPPDQTRRSGAQPALGDPTRQTGPRTVPVEGRARQVTFATRIELPKASGLSRAPLWFACAIGLVLASSGGLLWRRHHLSARAQPPESREAAPTSVPPPISAKAPPTEAPAAPAIGRLSIRTTPSGAEVRLGDRPLGTTPLQLDIPLSGPLALHLRRRGFQPLDRTLPPSAFAGTPRAATVDEQLTPVARGTLTLNALPWAHVTIDGEKRADTPILRLALAAGPHQIHLRCPPTGRELTFTVTVAPATEVKRLVDLRSEPKLIE
ncbi:MAG TPA: serine/threonine-protein kinase [Polyangia bacterium]|jgi:serine/threonine protein kinase